MRQRATISGRPPMTELMFSAGVIRRSAVVALIVGTILNFIAQGDFLLEGRPLNYWKIILTYLVPYCVATYGAVTARLESFKRADWQ